MAAEGSYKAYFRGNGANVIKNVPETALKLTCNDRVKSMIAQDGHSVTLGKRCHVLQDLICTRNIFNSCSPITPHVHHQATHHDAVVLDVLSAHFSKPCCRSKRGNWWYFWCYCTGDHLPHGSHPNKVGSQSCWDLQRNCKCILENCAPRRLQGSLQVRSLGIHLFHFLLSLAASLHDLARSSNSFLCCIHTNSFQQRQDRHVCPRFKVILI